MGVGSIDWPAARRLDPPALHLVIDASLLRALGGPRRPAYARNVGGGVDELLQARHRVREVALLRPVALRLDDHDACGCDALIAASDETRLDRIRKRRRRDVEAQMDGGRDLVDVLSTGALSADGGPGDLARQDRALHC